jgi:hypothetical protein
MPGNGCTRKQKIFVADKLAPPYLASQELLTAVETDSGYFA